MHPVLEVGNSYRHVSPSEVQARAERGHYGSQEPQPGLERSNTKLRKDQCAPKGDLGYMRLMRKQRIQVWPSPDVAECMGAKDVLCKVAGLSIGLSDTLAYTTADHFSFCFRKTMAFQPRVVQASRCTSFRRRYVDDQAHGRQLLPDLWGEGLRR